MATLPKSRQSQTIFSSTLSATTKLDVGTSLGKANVITGRHRDSDITAIMDSIKSKMVKDPNTLTETNTATGERQYDVDRTIFENTVNDTALSIAEARNQVDALPNLGLTIDVIISSVLSPNDMMSTELIYSCDTDIFGDLTPSMIAVVEDYFDNEYEIKKKLDPWLRQSLMMEGATALAVVPESSIDQAINQNMKITQESLSSSFNKDGSPVTMGHLRTPKYIKKIANGEAAASTTTFAFESFSVDGDVTYESRVGAPTAKARKWDMRVSVVDNPEVLKIPHINKKIREDRLTEIYTKKSFGIENFKKDIFKTDQIYNDRTINMRPTLTLKTLDDLDKKTLGHPVVFQFPTESVIPIYSPADPSEHVCYFVAVDEGGNPIRMDQNSDQYRSMEKNFNNAVNGQASSSLISSASAMGMTEANDNLTGVDNMARLYSQVIEHDLRERLDSGGFHGRDLKLGKANELYKLMFVRALAQMNTQLVFIPKELMTYIAFDYRSNGVGRSLLDKTKILGSLRMVEVMTSAIANTKSSIDHRTINIEIDPDDPDPMKRVTQYLHEFQRATKAAFPMGINSFADITDYLQKAGVQVKVTGHEGMPNMNMEVNNQRMDYNRPDDEYRDKIDKDHIMGLGAPPESIRSAADVEFAANVISGNAYFSKISSLRQDTYCIHLSDHLRKYTRSSQPLMDKLTTLVKENRDKISSIDDKYTADAIAIVFANNISVALPKPDMAQNAQQLEAFEKYTQILDIALPAFVSQELFSDINLGEKIGPAMDHIVAVLKAYFMRKWLTDNNVLPELFDLINETNGKTDKFEFLSDHTKRLDELAPAVREYIVKSVKRGTFSDGVIEKAEELTGGEQNDFNGGSDGGGFGSPDDGGGYGDGDDFNAGGDDQQDDSSFGDETGDDDFDFKL